ncbi:hypothetical protein JZ751_023577 [Albula glossodonta]|uniref:BPL/LPL catalytic domain-containing protein n=1 Tax=Albula glossodonta TaxID=121402 RepID=A0A8T2NJI6_9TELE|nr:hypothetical protein JZ751_023577 [Albula glossodonta]
MIIRTCINVYAKTQGCLRVIRPQSTFATVIEQNGKAGLVLKSLSTDIYENLAFEDWIHNHVDLQNRNILFLWRNASAVVIGRHQNPWQECNLRLMKERGVPLARRRTDLSLLSPVLKTTCQGIKSNATPSVPSPVKNLVDEDPTLDCDTIMDAVATRYNSEFASNGSVILVDPTDELSLPGIHKMASELESWEWVYGKTPKFSVSTSFEVNYEASSTNVMLNMDVKNGVIEMCTIELPQDWLPKSVCTELSEVLIGCKFCPNEVAVLTAAVLRTHPLDSEIETKMHILCQNVTAVM